MLTTPDLRKKVIVTLVIVAAARLGSAVPTPGVSFPNVQQCVAAVNSSDPAGVYSLLDLFSGGALLQLSVLAVGVTPYISASIVIQLLTVVVPRFERLKQEGQSGQHRLTQYTRYLAIAMATLQATSLVALASRGTLFGGCPVPVIPDSGAFGLATVVVVMVAGSALMMWFGELITEKGVGNGMSVLMFVSVAHRIPIEGHNILENAGVLVFAGVCLFGLAVVASVVFVEQGQRRIPVQYAKRMVGRRMYGGTSTYLPLKVNQAGVVPVIFASALLYLPQLASRLLGGGPVQEFVQRNLTNPASGVYIALFVTLIVFFTYFYVGITFDPRERADEMAKFGGFVPGIRPGRPTAEYLRFALSRITLPGSLYLGVIAVLPNFFLGITGGGQNQSFPFGGTSLLIMVGVGLDTVKQVETQLMQRNYEGFLR